jgi:uncharacterized protein
VIDKFGRSPESGTPAPETKGSLRSEALAVGQPRDEHVAENAHASVGSTPLNGETPTDRAPGERGSHKWWGKGPLSRLYDVVLTRLIEPLVLSRNPPWFDARSVTLGLVVGFGVPMGGHCLVLGLLRLVMRFNVVVAIGVAAVVNPLNIVPLYYGYYCLGSAMLGKTVSLNREVFETLMNPILDKSHFWEAIRAFMELGADILGRWMIAAVVVSAILGIAGYVLTLRIQKKRCKTAAKKLGMRYEEFLAQLETNATRETAPEAAPKAN